MLESKTLSEPSAPDLRSLLREAAPNDFPLKKAWRAVIQAARQHKRETGQSLAMSSLAAVERALGTVPCDPGLGVAYDWDFINAHRTNLSIYN